LTLSHVYQSNDLLHFGRFSLTTVATSQPTRDSNHVTSTLISSATSAQIIEIVSVHVNQLEGEVPVCPQQTN